jgi:hypothetical protein
MRPPFAIFVALLAVASLAQEKPDSIYYLVPDDILGLSLPTRHIVPEDVVPESIELFRFFKPPFIAVRFTYTEAGAQKTLAFKEAHHDQTVRLIIGKFETRTHLASLNLLPPGITNYAQWKQRWLQRRTDKIFVRTEKDAEKILAGLKSEQPLPLSASPVQSDPILHLFPSLTVSPSRP